MPTLTPAQIYDYALQGGFNKDQATIATAIAIAESGGRTDVVNGIGATGLWQIYPAQAGSTDPLQNAKQAYQKYLSQYWCAWAVYDEGSSTGGACPGSGTSQRNNSWRNFLSLAQSVSGVTGGSVGGGGSSGSGSSSGSGGSSSSGGSSLTGDIVQGFMGEVSGPIVVGAGITLLILGLLLWKGREVTNNVKVGVGKVADAAAVGVAA